jgi:hypothetical protein
MNHLQLWKALSIIVGMFLTQDAESFSYLRTLSEVSKGATEDADKTDKGVDLVHLIPFEVQVAVTSNMGIQTYEVSNIVTAWLNDAYVEQLALFGYSEENHYAEFNSVVLFNNEKNSTRTRKTQGGGALFIAQFRGGVVFSRDLVNRTKSVPENDVLVIQQTALSNDTGLLTLLQQATDATGLGNAVVDVNAFLDPNPSSVNNTNESSEKSDLDVVIIVAILVACVAFLFLLGAIIWAYRFDRIHRDAFLVKNHARSRPSTHSTGPMIQDKTSETDTDRDNESPERIRAVVERSSGSLPTSPDPIYPAMIGGDNAEDNDYPESVISDSVGPGSAISEDISTSLSQYYRAGMGKADYGRSTGLLSDAGSVSSMESYGYSLDGGMSMIPTEIPYQRERQRIGGLPIEPDHLVIGDSSCHDSMDDVQIPDLDKELSNLDIKLLPNENHADGETYSQQDLEDYQMQDLEEMGKLGSSIPPLVSKSRSQSDPVDIDELDDTEEDDLDDDDSNEALPTPPTTSAV